MFRGYELIRLTIYRAGWAYAAGLSVPAYQTIRFAKVTQIVRSTTEVCCAVMPIPLIAEGFGRGLSGIPYLWTVVKIVPWIALVYFLKGYFGGAKCRSERVMHSKVVLVTGGTSGIGAEVVRNLATRGAQVILLTHHAPTDPFLVDFIDDLRSSCDNELIYAEQVDMSSLHSIRTFATKWVDNAPPRRLDMIVLCAHTMTPYWGKSRQTVDGMEEEWMVNYVSAYHLLSILSPALRAQPPDRDVRILFSTCSSYIWGTLDLKNTEVRATSGSTSDARSKLALMSFATAFQKHLDAYDRPDKHVNNARALLVDPGWSRTPGSRRWLTGGSLLGLLVYLVTWPVWWLILKSPEQGAQSFLYAAMEAEFGRGPGGKMIKECREMKALRPEVYDEAIAKTLWEHTEQQIERVEKEAAIERAREKKARKEGKPTESRPDGNDSVSDSAVKPSAGNKQPTEGSRRARKNK